MVEFIVICGFVLVPLAIGITFVGKYVESKQQIETASRYSAWERTVWYQELPKTLKKLKSGIDTEKKASHIGYEIQNRVFSHRDSGIYKAQQNKSVEEKQTVMTKSQWVDDSNKSLSLYRINEGTFVTVGETKEHKMYGMTSGILDKFLEISGKVTGFDLDLKGASTSTISLAWRKPEFLNNVISQDIQVSRSSTLLGEGWNAAGPKHATSRVQGLLWTSLLDQPWLNKVRSVLAIVPIANEIGPDSLKFGHVVVDAVPEVRLEKHKHR